MADEDQPQVLNPPPVPPPSASDPTPPDGRITPPNSRPHAADVDKEAGISTAPQGGTLGEQVHPDTQTTEKDGHRTLANPVTDPGPVRFGNAPEWQHPDRNKGEHRYGDTNDPLKVTMRTSTGHDHGFARPDGDGILGDVELPPEVYANHAASDVYNKAQGKTLTERARQEAAVSREPAPLHE